MTFVLVSVLYKHICECIDDPFATPVTDATTTTWPSALTKTQMLPVSHFHPYFVACFVRF